MKKVYSIFILFYCFSCNNTHNSKQETDSISYKTDTVTAPIQENKNIIEPFEPRKKGKNIILDKIYSNQYGEIKLYKTENNDKDTVYVTLIKNKQIKSFFLSQVGFFNTSGKLTLNSFSKLLVELEIDYHTGVGGFVAYSSASNQKQKIVFDLFTYIKIFDCISLDENFSWTGLDSTKSMMETTEWKEDSTIYRYDFQFKNDTIWLKNLSGNSKPDKKMGRYVYDKNRYVLK